LPASLLIFVSAAAFAPSAFAATYSGSGHTGQCNWWVCWNWDSWSSVDTSSHVLSLNAAYPKAYNTWAGVVTFLSALVQVRDKNGQMWFGWSTGQDHCGWINNPNLCVWWYSTSYPTTNTGEIVTVFFYYGGVGIFGGVTGSQVTLQYSFNVGG
jgi:hypothetical protein